MFSIKGLNMKIFLTLAISFLGHFSIAYSQDFVQQQQKPIHYFPNFRKVAEKVMPCVVGVVAKSKEKSHPRSYGAGFVISQDGYIVTHNNILRDDCHYEVVFINSKGEFDERKQAQVIGKDFQNGVALLKIDAQKLSTMNFSDSD